MIVVRGVPNARRKPPSDVAVRYEPCGDHPPKVYRQKHREWEKICMYCHCKHEHTFVIFCIGGGHSYYEARHARSAIRSSKVWKKGMV